MKQLDVRLSLVVGGTRGRVVGGGKESEEKLCSVAGKRGSSICLSSGATRVLAPMEGQRGKELLGNIKERRSIFFWGGRGISGEKKNVTEAGGKGIC